MEGEEGGRRGRRRKEDGKEEDRGKKDLRESSVLYYVQFEFSDEVENSLPHRGTVVFVLSFQNQFLLQ